MNEAQPPKRYWISSEEKAEAEERAAWLDTLSHQELLELREQVAPGTTPAYTPPPEYDPDAAAQRYEQRMREMREQQQAQGDVVPKPTHKEKSKRTPEDIEADVYRNCGVEL